MRESDFGQTYVPARNNSDYLLSGDTPGPLPPLVSIESLRNTNLPAQPLRIRGVVTLTHPIYVQDSSAVLR
jgi:hypothetical protein